MNDIWTAAEVAAATGGVTSGDWKASGVSIDSRTIERGDLFIAKSALGGARFELRIPSASI